jgi:alkylation response protein AidB-like acyl-CoA dehydrogenase
MQGTTLRDHADRALAPAQRKMVADLRAYCEASLADGRVRELTVDYTQPHSEELARGLAERGWWGLLIDPRHGGAGGGSPTWCC